MAMLDDELHRHVLRMHVCHFSFDVVVSHDGRRKHDREILGRHLDDDVS